MLRIIVIFFSFVIGTGCLTRVYAQETAPTSKTHSDEAATGKFRKLIAKELHVELSGNTFYSSQGWHIYAAPEGDVYSETNQGSLRAGNWFVSIDGEYCRKYRGQFRCYNWGQQGDWFEIVSISECRRHVLRRVNGNPENHKPVVVKAKTLPLPASLSPNDIFYQAPFVSNCRKSGFGKGQGRLWMGNLSGLEYQ